MTEHHLGTEEIDLDLVTRKVVVEMGLVLENLEEIWIGIEKVKVAVLDGVGTIERIIKIEEITLGIVMIEDKTILGEMIMQTGGN